MRLGQLARKLAISPTEIVKFLESNNISALEGSNTRLSDDHTRLILQQFDPAGSLVLAAEPSEEPEPTPAQEATSVAPVEETAAPAAAEIHAQVPAIGLEPVLITATEPAPQAAAVTDATEGGTTETDEAAEMTELPDVIKAPKVTLAGLKVLGKIELPGPKKKEPTTPEDTAVTPEGTAPDSTTAGPEGTTVPESVSPAAPQPERRPRHERDGERRERDGERREGRDGREHRDPDGRRSRRSDNNRRNDKPRKNPVALQREREAHEAELKREAQAKAEKERRTQHYHSRVKSVPTKPARLIREQTEEMTDDHTTPPKTWLGKFWKWFRS